MPKRHPGLMPAALDIAACTYRRIRQGLFWAFAYNAVGIPLAAAGLLSPVVAGAAIAGTPARIGRGAGGGATAVHHRRPRASRWP